MSGGRGYMENIPSPQFCCEPKIVRKNKVCIFKNSFKFLDTLPIEK